MMDKEKIKKKLILNLPYIVTGGLFTNVGEAVRLSGGSNISERVQRLVLGNYIGKAFANPLISLNAADILVGILAGVVLKAAVYLKGKNAKKYRHGSEYGSARWGKSEDIAPFKDPVFSKNVILSKSEFLTMESRPKDPKYARNKNVLCVGGSGSGKTRYFIKPSAPVRAA